MKRIYFFFATLAIMAFIGVSYGQTQPPNSGFETWSGSLPTSWNSISQVNHISQTTPSHSGSYAAKLETKNVIFYGAVPGLLTLGTFNSSTNTIDGGIAFYERPDSLVVWYKYFPQSGDTAFVAMATFLNGDTVSQASAYLTATQSSWKRLSIPVEFKSSANPNLLNVGFLSSMQGSAQAGTYLIVDDVQLIYNWTFTCSDPTGLTANNISTNSASLNWVSGGTVTSWDIQYGISGFSLGSGTIVNTTNKPYLLSGLIDDTGYDFYVKAHCSNETESNWVGPYNFTTLNSCLSPSNLTASSITLNAASLNWAQGSTETQWILEWGLSGFTQGTGTTVSLSSKPYLLSGLLESTSYSFYVRADCGGGKLSNWAGPYTFITLSSCPPPTLLTATNIGTNAATLNWEAGGSESQWQIEWGIAGFVPGTGTLINISSVPYVLNGLMNGTQYQYYVKAVCGGNSSVWAGPFGFTTNSVSCDVSISNFPWQEGFEDGFIPNCWTQIFENGSVSWIVGTGNNSIHPDDAQEGTMNALIKITNPLNKNKITKLVTPAFDLTNLSNIQLRFWHVQPAWSADQDELRVYYRTSITSPWILLETYTSDIQSWTEHVISLPNKSAQYYIAFESKLMYGYGVGIDNVSISGTPVSCTAPAGLSVSNITQNSAELSWTETGTASNWVLEWGLHGFTPGTGTIVNTTSTNYSLSGLNPNTNYDFFVKANCGTETSAASITNTFTTAQNPCVISNFPWTEGFEGGVLPTCWSEILVLGTNHWQFLQGNGGSNPSTAHTGTKNAVLKRTSAGTDSTRLITPVFDLSHLMNPVLKFWHTQQVWSYDQDQLRVYYKTSATGPWVLLATYTSSISSWTERTLTLPNPSAVYQIAFAGTAKYGYGVCIDDVSITGITVSCLPPSALTVSGITETSAVLNWTENNGSTSWEIQYGPFGFTLGNGTIIGTSVKPFTLENLSANGNYSFYVRTQCNSTDLSSWSGPYNFQTPCGPPVSVFPWTEGFEGGTLPPCWTEEFVTGTINWEFATGGYGTSGAVMNPSGAHTGTYNARFRNNDNYTEDVTKLITPPINLSSITSPVLKFWHTQANWSGDQDELRIYYKTSSNGAWNLLAEYTSSISTWTERTIALPNASSEYYIAFEGLAMYGYGACVDDVSIIGTPILNSEKEILSFSIPQQIAPAVINSGNATVALTVPYGTNVANLTPVITVSPNATINPASGVVQNFSNPVNYTVTAQNGTTKMWTVTVSVAPFVSSEAEIISFTHPSQTAQAIINSANATVSLEVAGGTGLTSLIPQVTVSIGAGVVPLNGSAVNFTNPVIYTVTAADSTKKDWMVTVIEAPVLSSEAEIVSFSLAQQTGPAIINSSAATVTIEVNATTLLSSLTPAMTISAGATSVPSASATLNFTTPVQYIITAENGVTQKTWTVTVTRQPSAEAEIVSFSFPEQIAPAVINSANATVEISVENATDLSLLIPTITISQGATINPASGIVQDFTAPVQYTVTAENTITQKNWTVNVTLAPPSPVVIVKWDFPNTPDDSIADDGIQQNLASILTTTSTGTLTFADAGASTNCAKATGWESGNGVKFWQTDFSTEMYTDITVSSKQYSSNLGPKNFKLQYKIGASGSWEDVPNGTITVGGNWTGGVLTDLPLPAVCNNQPELSLRWIMSSNTSVLFIPVNADGSSAIDDIIVKGMLDITLNNTVTEMQDICIYPNPVNDLLNISFGKTYSEVSLSLLNAEGKIIERADLKNSNNYTLNMVSCAKGFYFVRIFTTEGYNVFKVVK